MSLQHLLYPEVVDILGRFLPVALHIRTETRRPSAWRWLGALMHIDNSDKQQIALRNYLLPLKI